MKSDAFPPSVAALPTDEDSFGFLGGGGEMGARIRQFDWSTTPLGSPTTWSPALRTTLRILLANRFPHILWWGPEFIQFYNDPYRPIPGSKHPERVLGRRAGECWQEIWQVIGPLIERPFGGGEATWDEDIFLEVHRHGFTEETHFTIAYSPVPDETVPGGIGGVLATVHEITQKVIAERRALVLRDLGAHTGEAQTADDACARVAKVLAAHDKDVPFALIYLIDEGQKRARLVGLAGATSAQLISAPHLDLKAKDPTACPLAKAFARGEMQLIENLSSILYPVPQGPWSDPPGSAVVIPIPSNRVNVPAALLLAGVSARLKFDAAYRDFFELLKTQVATAITHARAFEEEKNRAEALAELDRAKTTFFSNVSHELRTPLTLLLGPLEDELRDHPENSRIALAHRNSLRLLKLVNTLLDFTRIEAGRVQASYEATDLALLTAELASVFRSAIEGAGLNLILDCPPLPDLVHVDREMWEKIVLNLLSNAFKFTFEGEIKVSLRWRADAVELVVSDTGAGIPQSHLPRVFDRFHRVPGAHARTHEGTGIGLALVQELARLHGGSAEVISTEGRGTAFTIRLPTGTAHLPPDRIGAPQALSSTAIRASHFVNETKGWISSTEDAAMPVASHSKVSHHHLGSARLLLADDNADMRAYLTRLLEPHYEVTALPDGQAAIEAARARRPDLILSDVMMPGLDGFGLLRELRSDPELRTIPVILLSARAGEESRVEGLDQGADDYLIKPFSARELLARVEAHLKLSRLRHDGEIRLAADLAAITRLHELAGFCAREGLDVAKCLNEILAAAIALTGADKGNVQLFEESSGLLKIAVHRGFGGPFLDFFANVGHEGAATCAAAMREVQRIAIEDITQSELFAGQPTLDVLCAEGVRAVQSTPLVSTGGTLLGMISTHFTAPRRFDKRELGFLDLLARQAADYIERVRADEALRKAKECAESANRAKDNFLAALSHELRNPLNPVLLCAGELEQDGSLPAEAREKLSMMRRNIQLEARLIDDLLDLTRISRGKIKLHPSEVDVHTLLRHTEEIVRSEVGADRMDLHFALEATEHSVQADPARLQQVFWNLINNAVKFSAGIGGVKVRTFNPAPKRLAIEITDTGIGIAAEALTRIFRPFDQGELEGRKSFGGLGLGLSISQAIVDLHGGELHAASPGLGRGSTFTVQLATVAASVVSPLGPAPEFRAAPLRLLVVEDHEATRDVLARLLERDGHKVHVARSVKEALVLSNSHECDMLISDLGLPDGSGVDVMRALRSRGAAMPGIALSGYGTEEDVRDSRSAGFTTHLLKPVNMDDLRCAMRSICGAAPGKGISITAAVEKSHLADAGKTETVNEDGADLLR